MDIREFFFKYRSFTPIPLALIIIYFSRPALPYIWIGFIFLVMGEGVRFAAVRYAGGVTRTTKVGAPSLCTAGPFAWVRNPLYIGNMLMYTGIVLIAGAPNIWAMLLVTWTFFGVQYSQIISLEEDTLAKLFGVNYNTYIKNVPAIIPRLKSWPNDDARKPATILNTFKTERRTLQNVFLVLIILFIRNQLHIS